MVPTTEAELLTDQAELTGEIIRLQVWFGSSQARALTHAQLGREDERSDDGPHMGIE